MGFDLGNPGRESGVHQDWLTMQTGEITIRVRYAETDRMGLVHHANFLVYFEQGRTELLRTSGLNYKDLEDQGFLLVITKAEINYRSPARYDDLLIIRTSVTRVTTVRIDLAEGSTALACVDREGRVQLLPDFLRTDSLGA